MQLPDEAPKLPKLPFLLGDSALLATAWYIARSSEVPLAPVNLLAIVGCVALGAILAVIPFVAEYGRKQEEALQDRQNALEALSRTTATAAEQISIAASGLHTIAELAQKNLKAAEQLGPKLQEKINEFARRADEALVAENEALTQEVNTLRASEAEKLETTSDKVRAAATELTKLEAATHKHLAAVSETLARLPALAEASAQKAAGIHSETARATLAQLLTELDIRMAAAVTRLAALPAPPPVLTPSVVASEPAPSAEPDLAAPAAQVPAETTEPKRKRTKSPAKEAAIEAAPPASAESAPAVPAPLVETTPVPLVEAAPTPPEPKSLAAPDSNLPSPTEPASAPVPVPEPALTAEQVPATEAAPLDSDAPLPPPDDENAAPKPARKPRKPISASAPPFIPGLLNSDAPLSRPGGDFSSVDAAEASSEEPSGPPIDRAISADGLTRLLATAYIGIGNKLYLRGDGPGLSWDKGVPLQFVSIGKWRWETAEATASFSAKLYKNDQIECVSLGSLTLDPGQQTEVNAAF
jgi:hypothetical protein